MSNDHVFSDQELQALSAKDLVELIELEEELIAEYEIGGVHGALALWTEIERRQQSRHARPRRTVSNSRKAVSADQAVQLYQQLEQLNLFAEQLEQRSLELAKREAELAETAEQLIRSQQELLAQLDQTGERDLAPEREAA